MELTPTSLWLAGVGALLMLIAVFLPRVEATSFSFIQENTLIQSGDGWLFVLLAVSVAGTVWRAYRQQTSTLAPMILGAVGIAAALYEGMSKSALRLCPIGAAAALDVPCEQGHPSIGIYAAGIGSLLVVIGGRQIWQAKKHPLVPATATAGTPNPPPIVSRDRPSAAESPPTKKCPDCAETILAEAHVCRFCGYRFDAEAAVPVSTDP